MKLNYAQKQQAFYRKLTMIGFITFLSFWNSTYSQAANITLKGEINIGDNDDDAIYPAYMLTASGRDWWTGLLTNPVPVNPIHFHLSEAKVLKKIELLSIDDADDRLYFVIWNENGDVVVNTRSHEDKNGKEHAGQGHAHFENDPYAPVSLPAGSYRLAVVGQCFVAGIATGWSNTCFGGTQDDFEFEDIKLKMDESRGIADSISFIQRRHIGDSDEGSDDGYAGRWYPDDEEGSALDYRFKPNQNASSALITMYGYRDLLIDSNDVQFVLYKKNKKNWTVIDSTSLRSSKSSGDFEWSVSAQFKKNKEYALQIYTQGSGDLDDISWDDIVIKFDEQDDDVMHYRIQHPLDALTCDVTSVVIQACSNNGSDANCNIVDSDETLTLSVNNQDQQVNLSNGSATVSNLAQLYAGTMSLALKNKNNQYCNSSTSTSSQCNINYAELGLKFSNNPNMDRDILDQIAGHSMNPFYIRAVKDDGSGTCTELDLPTNNFDLGLECVEPNVCSSLNFFVTGKNLGKNGAKTNVLLSKVMTGAYTIADGRYDDAGKIRLSARYNFRNGSTAVGSSNDFHVRPDRFVVKATTSDNNDLTDKSGGILRHTQVAAKSFSFIVEAVNKSGNTTLNYVPNAGQAHSVSLNQTLPSNAAFDGVFTYASNKSLNISKNKSTQDLMLTAFKNGRSAFTSALYDEVGAFNVAVKDDDYYGMAFQTNTDTEIGRFIPAYFELKSPSVDNYIQSVGNNPNSYDHVYPDNMSTYVAGTKVLSIDGDVYQCRPEWNNSLWCPNPGYEPGVIDHDGNEIWSDAWILLSVDTTGFTYMDQPELGFGYRLEAQNSLGVITKNYDGDLNADVTFSAEVDGIRNVSFSKRLEGFGGGWHEGVYEPLSLDIDKGLFARLASIPDGPIMNTFFGISIVDVDGVLLNDTDMLANTELPAAKSLSAQVSELRYGRWNIADNYGPIVLPLPTLMSLEYYDGRNFIANADDNRTTFTHALAKASMIGSIQPSLSGSGGFDGGVTQELLISSSAEGDSVLEYEAPLWLEFDWSNDGDYNDDPSAIINFGFFRGNDQTIYRRRLN